jgi:hypothetical protein
LYFLKQIFEGKKFPVDPCPQNFTTEKLLTYFCSLFLHTTVCS